MANSIKGTLEVEIAGERFILLPSFDALCELEEKIGCSAVEAFQNLGSGKVSIKIVAACLWAGIQGYAMAIGDRKMCVSFSVIGEKIRQDGLRSHVKNAIEFLGNGLIPQSQQGQEPQGE